MKLASNSVILSEDWSLREKRKDQPQSKDPVFASATFSLSGSSYPGSRSRVPHFSRVFSARSGDFSSTRYPFIALSITFRSAALIRV